MIRPTTRASWAASARRTRQLARKELASISASASAFTASPASWTSAGCAVAVSSPTADPTDPFLALPPLPHHGPGPYRVRVHTRGRDDGKDLGHNFGEPVEHHLIQARPAP
ncbi:hypothetical protein [Kitasatospora sp. NPDC089509]|uniref:hypothetical protein n=1 Tax=Kitasatospora sp. NPDC089509 TaxID=3364079 RepID=UPI003819BD13